MDLGRNDPSTLIKRGNSFGGEILGSTFSCNLASVHTNLLNLRDFEDMTNAFTASALQGCAFLNRGFTKDIHQKSRDLDPIIGVSFTGIFTAFTKLFGIDWLRWWQAGRPRQWGISDDLQKDDEIVDQLYQRGFLTTKNFDYQSDYFKQVEQVYFEFWKTIVRDTVFEYCDSHGLKRPNRYTTMKPEGTGTLLTGSGSCGMHPPKAWLYIRRITFRKGDPIALAAMQYGYNVIPSTKDHDENGNLLNDPFDKRCTEWLVEVPTKEEVVDLYPEAENIDPGKFSFAAQFDFMMQVQNFYVTHNTSSTLELRENEIEEASNLIFNAIQNDDGYISSALLARFDDNGAFPRLPFEPISKERYDQLMAECLDKRVSDDFMELYRQASQGLLIDNVQGDSACSDGFCEIAKIHDSKRESGDIFAKIE